MNLAKTKLSATLCGLEKIFKIQAQVQAVRVTPNLE